MKLIKVFPILMIAIILMFSELSQAKVINPSAEKGENKIYIRADGLACYFCAYGLERFFKKSGKIAWYDMDMKKGLVEVGFIKGKPIIDVKTIKGFIHDAGYSAREIKAEFVGRLIKSHRGEYSFKVTETGQNFPVEENSVIKKSMDFDKEITLKAEVKEDSEAPMKLVPEQILPGSNK